MSIAEKLGFFKDMDMSEYHSKRTGISKSGLVQIKSYSPKRYQHYINYGFRETEAMALGTAAHKLILEPDLFYKEYYQVDSSLRRNTKAWKEIEAANPGKTPIKENDWNDIFKMLKSVENHSLGKKLIQGASLFEPSYIWIDERTGLKCKCRPDALHEGLGVVVDLKTTRDARKRPFTIQSQQLHYHVSSAFTLEGINQLVDKTYSEYLFLVIDKTAPFECAIFKNDREAIMEGKKYFNEALDILKKCIDEDNWPGINDDEVIDMPVKIWRN